MDHSTTEEFLDPFLLSVLQNTKNRDTLKKLEETLNQFVLNSELQRLEFPPKGAFQRRIIYRVASRYGLDNLLLAAENNGTKSDKRRLILLKTEQTKIPSVLLSEWEKSVVKRGVEQTATENNTNNKPLFLKRNVQHGTQRTFHRSSSFGGLESGTGNVIRGVTEEEYQKARARIFNSEDVAKCSQTQLDTTSIPQGAIKLVDASQNKTDCQLESLNNQTPQDSLVASTEDKETENDVYDPDFDRSYSRWGATIPISSCTNNGNQNFTDSYAYASKLRRPPGIGNYNPYAFPSKYQNILCGSFKGIEPSSTIPQNISNDPSLTSSYPALQFPSYHLHCSFDDSAQPVTLLPNSSVSATSHDSSIYLSKDPTSSYIHEFPPLGRT